MCAPPFVAMACLCGLHAPATNEDEEPHDNREPDGQAQGESKQGSDGQLAVDSLPPSARHEQQQHNTGGPVKEDGAVGEKHSKILGGLFNSPGSKRASVDSGPASPAAHQQASNKLSVSVASSRHGGGPASVVEGKLSYSYILNLYVPTTLRGYVRGVYTSVCTLRSDSAHLQRQYCTGRHVPPSQSCPYFL